MGADTKTELTLRDSCKERTSFGRVLAPALDTIGQPRGPTELCCTLHCRQCKERFACNETIYTVMFDRRRFLIIIEMKIFGYKNQV